MAQKPERSADIEYYELGEPDNYKQTIVIFHGYGADSTDLFSFADEIKTELPTRWLFVNGPQTVIIDSYMSGRAWFEIDPLKLSLVMQAKQFDEFVKFVPKALSTTRQRLMQFVKALDLDIPNTIFGGFSQGSMMALDLAFHLPKNPKGLILLSSSIINIAEWKMLAVLRKGTPFFQSHGTNDPLLRIEIARKLEGLLTGSGLKGRLHEFNGAHEIPEQIIEKTQEFVNRLS